jgi:hypothetical protein
MATPVFGAAVELRGFSEWILHGNVEKSVDALLSREPCKAIYLTRVNEESGAVNRDGGAVEAAPLIGLHQSREGFAYIRTRKGDAFSTLLGVPGGDGPDFAANEAGGGQVWAAVSTAAPNIWEPARRVMRKGESQC